MLMMLHIKDKLIWIKYLTDKKFVMAKIKVTQIKSRIGSTVRQKRTLDALGLKKLHNPKVHEATPQVMGMVEKVRHLVKTEEV